MLPRPNVPVLLRNASASVPTGLYRLTAGPVKKGALAAIRLPSPLLKLAARRGYLGPRALLIKPVAATAGDIVCRRGQLVTINGAMAASVRTVDAQGRKLVPMRQGCRRLRAGQVFVLSRAPGSFDSRYIGVVDGPHILGRAEPLWIDNGRL